MLLSPPGKGTHGASDRSTGDAYSSYAPDLTSGISRGQCLPCTIHFVLFCIYTYEIDQGSLSLPCFATWPFILTNLNPLYPRIFGLSLVEIGSVVLEKKIF